MPKSPFLLPKMENIRELSRILIAPLDWGLGHATRCIPVICALKEAGHEVFLAASGPQETLFRQVFPNLPILPIPGYEVRYGRTARQTTWQLVKQLPKIRRRIKNETKWLADYQQKYHFDVVVSDNRFGLHHPDIHCIFITHQLYIIHPWGNWASQILQKWNYKQIEKFNACWIPDYKEAPGLAGKLSHPSVLPNIPVEYIGPLSRLHKSETPIKKGHLFISISGPEPQRSMMEDIVLQKIAHYNGSACIVRGLPGERNQIPGTNSIEVVNHLDAGQYAEQMAKAEKVICRSGYSTIMDLERMQKEKVFLIPTGGQTEQEYLAQHLKQFKGWQTGNLASLQF